MTNPPLQTPPRCRRSSAAWRIRHDRRFALLAFGLAMVFAAAGNPVHAHEDEDIGGVAAPRRGVLDREPALGLYNRAIRFDLRIGAWLPQMRSNERTSNIADDRVNFNNMDVSPDNAFPAADAAITLLRIHRFRIDYWDSTSSGKTFLSNNVTFNGTLFPSGSNVESTIELTSLKLGYELLLLDSRVIRLGIGGGADILSTKSQIKLTSGASESTREDDYTIWFLTGELAINFGFLEVFATVDGLDYGERAVFDGRVGAALCFDLPPDSPLVAFGAGADWRLYDAIIDDDDLDAEWTVQGLELFVFARF